MSPSAFDLVYDELRARWPESTEERDVATPYGSTRVHVYGRADGSPLLLLPGGSATGLVWFANAPALGRQYRVHAVDLLGDAGRTERRGAPLKSADDLESWLDALMDGLGLARTHLCGHSYGAWLAVRYALHTPQRVARLALVDPTQVFAGFRPGYLLRALPTLIRPSEARARAFLSWETADVHPDETWQRLYALATTVPDRRFVTGGRPRAADLRMPVLVLLAEHSRAHHAGKVADRARRTLSQGEVALLPGATHHSLPLTAPKQLNERLMDFLG
ncbi:Pimeloyl-ACP methyl ester carboxylesterase [Parafrankia irregularis]|uniref:Pimeloyl-ACP methyl ester carboxylesterase n=1 Tax=Parafrankia irregularis TaxID=795642 RepID=A0A0S4QLG8_9ACTN|nr:MULTISPECIES: alpha/beta fold hydrolase [Parafrankia]MBE3201152.1 alpha/beta fold hydrolase [Parafrankia sp. CH37]CUU56416.1 Pimeloyl-ACP methyl ester carboxylesterase [Parafrankia irregularis]